MPINIALFKNENKEKDSQPDYKGWNSKTGESVAGWVKEASNGSKYISLTFKTAEENAQFNKVKVEETKQQVSQPDAHFFDDDQDIPF